MLDIVYMMCYNVNRIKKGAGDNMKKDKMMRVTSLEQQFIKELRNKKVRDELKESLKLQMLEKRQLKKELCAGGNENHVRFTNWFVDEINILSSLWHLLQDMGD